MKIIDIAQDNYRVLTANEGKDFLGRIVYTKWYSGNRAEITINQDAVYQMEPKGFWQSTLEIFKEGIVMLNIKSKFTGYEISRPIDADRPYRFKMKGLFKNGYVLVNYKDEVVLEIVSNFSWKKMYPGFTITCSDNFGNDDFEKLLIMLSVHFSRTLHNAAVTSAAG